MLHHVSTIFMHLFLSVAYVDETCFLCFWVYCLDKSFLGILSRWKFLGYCLDESYLRCFYLCFLGLFFSWKLLITSCFLSKIILSKKLFITFYVNYIFFKHLFGQKFIALHLNESCLCSLLCFWSVLRYLNKAYVCFLCAKYLNKKMIVINCPDNLNYYTT